METRIVFSQRFGKEAKRLNKRYKSFKEDLLSFKEDLIKDRLQETPLGGGLYKVRMEIKSKNKGKSGGARVITYETIIQKEAKEICLLTLYDKSERENITTSMLKQMLKEYFEQKR